MSNTIKVKRGAAAPTTSNLEEYELGYSTNEKNLYIRDGNSIVPINDNSKIEQEITDINKKIENVSGIVIGTVAPENIGALWIDTTDDGSGNTNGIVKYYDETTTTWVEVAATWG